MANLDPRASILAAHFLIVAGLGLAGGWIWFGDWRDGVWVWGGGEDEDALRPPLYGGARSPAGPGVNARAYDEGHGP